MASLEEAERFIHQDLAGMPYRRLRVEQWRCQSALEELDDGDHSRRAEDAWEWWWARYEAVHSELERRRG